MSYPVWEDELRRQHCHRHSGRYFRDTLKKVKVGGSVAFATLALDRRAVSVSVADNGPCGNGASGAAAQQGKAGPAVDLP